MLNVIMLSHVDLNDMLSVVMLSVVMLSVVMLSVVMLSVIMLIVEALDWCKWDCTLRLGSWHSLKY